jgi:hypothetical protein
MNRFRLNILVAVGVLFLLLLLTSNCVVDSSVFGGFDEEARESFDHTVTVGNQQGFRIQNVNGSIDIKGEVDATTVEIRGEKIVKSKSMADAVAHLDDIRIIINEGQNEIFVRTEHPAGTNRRNYEVVYHVRVPASWLIDAENANGLVVVDSVQNNIDVQLTNGDVLLSNIVGNSDVELMNGNVGLTDISGSVEAGVANGRIYGDVTLPIQGVCQLGVTNGQIDLELPVNTSAQFAAVVTNGSISISNLTLNNVITTQNSRTGTLGNGEGTIALTVVNGEIDVTGFNP